MKALLKYLENREAAISDLLGKHTRLSGSRTLHELRIEIKKLNAFFDLIDFCAKHFERKKMFKPFKLIFRQAGKLRELQVEEAILNKHASSALLTDYRNSLKKLRIQEQKDFYSITNQKFIARLKKTYREATPFVAKTHRKKVSVYMKKRRKKIEKLVNQNSLDPPHLHKLRKRLKEFEYNRNSLGIPIRNRRMPKVSVLPQLLGKWHDCQVIIRHLKKVIDTGGINPTEISQLKKIETKISTVRDLLLEEIGEALIASEFYRDDLRC